MCDVKGKIKAQRKWGLNHPQGRQRTQRDREAQREIKFLENMGIE